jgi:hypothetical protein
MLRRFKTVTIFDFDPETGRSKIVSHYTTQLGEDVKIHNFKKVKPVKEEPKTATSDFSESVEF